MTFESTEESRVAKWIGCMVCLDKLSVSKCGWAFRKAINGLFSPGSSILGNQSMHRSPIDNFRSFGHRPSTRQWTSVGTDDEPSIASSSRSGHRLMSISQNPLKMGWSSKRLELVSTAMAKVLEYRPSRNISIWHS